MDIQNRIDKLAKDVIKETYGSITDKDIKKVMVDILEKAKANLILNALGIRYNQWDKLYEPDNYGTFAKIVESSQKDYLNKIAKNLYEEIFGDENFKIELSEKDKIHFRKTFKDTYKEVFDDIIMNLAREKASIDAEKYFNDYLNLLEI
ncbi:MAG TPA: hypothetical protein DDY71_11165 [Spirochaetia bacterium]|nr:hypothetical protein [Spirochaetia bacterium]